MVDRSILYIRFMFLDLVHIRSGCEGLAGRRGRALRQVAGDALAEHLMSEKSKDSKDSQKDSEDSFLLLQRSRREKYLKTIRGLQLKRFGEKSLSQSALSFTALIAALSITCRVSFRAALKAFRFSARRFSTRP